MTIAEQFATLGTAALASPQPPVIIPGPPATNGNAWYLDPRDYGAAWNGKRDDTFENQKALDEALDPALPSVVRFAAARSVTGPLHIPGPGVQVEGVGVLRMPQDGRCSVLVSRDDPFSVLPLLSFDASKLPSSYQWLCNISAKNIGFDVTNARQFHGSARIPVVAVYGVSGGVFQDLRVFGNTGRALDIACNPAEELAWSENLEFIRCGCIGGLNSDGTPSPAPQTDHLVSVAGDHIDFYGGLFGYSLLNDQPRPAKGDATDFCHFLWKLQVRTKDGKPASSTTGGIHGTAITNAACCVKVQAVDAEINGTKWICGPTGLVFERLEVENYCRGLVVGEENVSGSSGWPRIRGIIMRDWTLGGQFQRYGEKPRQVFIDNAIGGEINLPFLGDNGDLVRGNNTRGVRVAIGPNPNGYIFRAYDNAIGWVPPISYVD